MRNNKHSKTCADSKQKKSIFVLRVIGVVIENRPFIVKRGLSLFEANTVVLEIGSRFLGIPIEAKSTHTYIVRTTSNSGKVPPVCLTFELRGAFRRPGGPWAAALK